MARCVSCNNLNMGDLPEVRVQDPHRQDLLDCMDAQRTEGRLCDVILTADGSRFPAHRCVLAAASPYFRSMFEEFNFTESLTREVALQSVDRESLSSLLDLIYTGTLHLTTRNVHFILAAADHLLLSKAKTFCAQFLRSVLTSPDAPREVLKIHKSAELYVMPDLLHDANKLIAQQLHLVVKSEDFFEQDKNDIVQLLRDDCILDKDESVVWEAALSWLKYDITVRRQHVEAVLGVVRLPLMTAQFLVEVVGREELVIQTPAIMKLLQEAMCFQLLPVKQSTLQSCLTRPRIGGQDVLVYCLAGQDHFLVYSPVYDCWYSLQSPSNRLSADLNTKDRAAEEGQLNYSIMIVGGSVYAVVQSRSVQEVGHFRLKALLRYKGDLNDWVNCSLPSRHCYNTLIGCQGVLYACSRQGIEVYQQDANTWSPLCSTKLSPCHFVVSEGNQIYCYNLQEGVVEVIQVDRKSSYKQQMMTQSLYVDDVSGVTKMIGHEVFLSLRTFSAGIIRRILNVKTQQWKDVLLCRGLSPLPQPGVHFPHCLDPAELWEVQCDRRSGTLYVLGIKSIISDIPHKSSYKLGISKSTSVKKQLDGVLPFFHLDQLEGTWKRLACLPEWLASSSPRLCVRDGQVSMATIVP